MPVLTNLQDVLKVAGADNDGGLGVFVWIALLQDVLTFPKVPAAPANYSELVTVSTNFTMKSGKKFYKIQNTLEASSLNTTLVGERDGRSAENMYSGQVPGNKPEAIGMLEYLKNADIVAIVWDHATGQYRIMGSEYLPASLETAEVSSGAKVADMKAVKFTFKSVGRVAPVYTGAIPETAAL